jgi:hypothetical protein
MLLNKAEKGVNIFFVVEYLVRWYSRNLRPSYPLVFFFIFVYFHFVPPFFFVQPLLVLCEAMCAWWTKATHVIRLPKPLLNTLPAPICSIRASFVLFFF